MSPEPEKDDNSQDRIIKSLLRPESEYESKSGPTTNFEDFVVLLCFSCIFLDSIDGFLYNNRF